MRVNKAFGLLMVLWIGVEVGLKAQITLTLDSCIAMAERNYPQIQQRNLLNQSAAFNLDNASKGVLPRIQLIGQATYQSDVTGLPGGGLFNTPQISKDQYRIYGEIVQPLTDVMVVQQQKKMVEAGSEAEAANLEVKLYALRQRVSDLFFGVLLLEGQHKQLLITQEELERGLNKINAAREGGIAYQSQVDQLKAELLGLEQRMIQLDASLAGFSSMLKLFAGIPQETALKLVLPQSTVLTDEISRPELRLFSTQQQLLDLQQGMVDKQNLPKFFVFFQGGFGRPALNMLSNDFEPYYITGLRLSWNLSNFYTSSKQKELFTVKRDIFENERETFLFNLDLALASKYLEISKMAEVIQKDKDIIELRERVVRSGHEQLANGVITATEYKNMVSDADLARQSLNVHQIEWMKKQNEYKLTTGN